MKRTKTKKLVLTDGKYYYENRSAFDIYFTTDPRKAWNYYCERFPNINEIRYLHWEIGLLAKNKSHVRENPDIKVDLGNFKLKWITIIETIKEEEFNYEGFIDTYGEFYDEKYKVFPL